jgi:hypothetical protein
VAQVYLERCKQNGWTLVYLATYHTIEHKLVWENIQMLRS